MSNLPAAADAFQLVLLKNALESITDEMSLALVRTGYSTVMREAMDFSIAICDTEGRVLAQGITLPLHLGGLEDAVLAVVKSHGADAKPEDVFILNDPFGGGSHLPDIFTVSPVFLDEELLGYVATVAHHSDVGGRIPGSNAADSTEIYQEGLRIPISWLYRAGEPNETLFGIIGANVRLPDTFLADLRAQLAAARIGAQRFVELAKKAGWSVLKARLNALLDYSERMTRAELSRLPPGKYRFTDFIDDDGLDDVPVKFSVSIEIVRGSILADFSGSSSQVRGAINCTYSFTKSAVYVVVASLVDPDIPKNAGFFRPIEVVAPEGTVLNVQKPGACAARAVTGHRAIDALYGAVAQALPNRILAAGDGGNALVTIAGTDDRSRQFVLVDSVVGAWGARPNKDGLDGNSPMGVNMRNQSIEAIEAAHPVRIEQYGYVQDSGGPGRFRGGMGVVRDYRLLGPKAVLQVRSDRKRFRPYGLSGGRKGTPSLNLLNPGQPVQEELPSKFSRTIQRGDLFRHVLPGGGGFGNPLERDPELVAEDVHNEHVSREQARDVYGVVFNRRTGALNLGATARKRQSLRQMDLPGRG